VPRHDRLLAANGFFEQISGLRRSDGHEFAPARPQPLISLGA
jgi:hypothetical protein